MRWKEMVIMVIVKVSEYVAGVHGKQTIKDETNKILRELTAGKRTEFNERFCSSTIDNDKQTNRKKYLNNQTAVNLVPSAAIPVPL
jgi:hypothetical protein